MGAIAYEERRSPRGFATTRNTVMCGIVAMYAARDRISEAALQQATRRLWHRGPDGRGTWVSADGRVALGHSRLSIIDLDTGDQPIAGEDHRLDPAKVVALLDELPTLDDGSRTAYDPCLMILLSACALHTGYGLS
jgi:hypothetical protein